MTFWAASKHKNQKKAILSRIYNQLHDNNAPELLTREWTNLDKKIYMKNLKETGQVSRYMEEMRMV